MPGNCVQWELSCSTRTDGGTYGWRDRHDETNSLFRNFENAPTNRPFTPLGKVRGFSQLANMLSESEASKPVIPKLTTGHDLGSVP